MPQPTENPLVKARLREQRSPHNRIVALVLCWFLGLFGVHRFYVGKFLTGVLMLVTGGGFGIWWIIDFVVLLLGRFRDAEGRVLGPPQLEYESLEDQRARSEKVRKQLPPPKEPVEPELAPVEEDDVEFEDVMRDPLEDKFAELEKELTKE